MVEIKHTLTGEVIISGLTARAAVLEAIETGVSLERAVLSGVDLRGIDFRGADMRYATFTGAFLRDVNFMGADFKGLNVQRSRVDRVNTGKVDNPVAHDKRAVQRRSVRFGRINLKAVSHRIRKEWANLRWSNADRARVSINLRWADLSGANLSGADLRGADLKWALMQGADLIGSDCREVDLTHVIGWGE